MVSVFSHFPSIDFVWYNHPLRKEEEDGCTRLDTVLF